MCPVAVGQEEGLRGFRGSRVGLPGPRGSRGGPTGSKGIKGSAFWAGFQGVKGKAKRVQGGQRTNKLKEVFNEARVDLKSGSNLSNIIFRKSRK